MELHRSAPLQGIDVLDLSALGPGPFASMMLADYGANVLTVGRLETTDFDPSGGLARGKARISMNLRDPLGVELIARLALKADVLLESFRPGVLERLGLGPEPLMLKNSRLIYARLTGWGQTGPYALRAGHDINYLAIAGALGASGVDEPTAPPALLGDIANGSYLAVVGILMALYHRELTGRGQIVDASITDGAVLMLSAMFGEMKAKQWSGRRGEHLLSGRTPFYGVYRCSDGKWFSVGAIESKFYAAFLDALRLDDVDRSPRVQWDRSAWPALRSRIETRFAQKPRDVWTDIFAQVDACGAPVLDISELPSDPHLAARGTVVGQAPQLRAAAAPRLFDISPAISNAAIERKSAREILYHSGTTEAEIESLIAQGTLAIDCAASLS
jgi:alpha-methylacyl-CoA racemase